MILWTCIILIALLSYVLARAVGAAYYSKFLDSKKNWNSEENRKITWDYYEKFEKIKVRSEIAVLILSILCFLYENLNSTTNLLFIILYSLIIISTVSNLIDIMEARLNLSDELNIPLGKKDRILRYIKSKLK